MAVVTPTPKTQFLTADGAPLVGGRVYTYQAGTTTPQATYTDSSGTTANSNPIILDSRGEANIWLGESVYKFKLADADDVEIWTVDYVAAPTTSLSPVLSGNVTISTDSSGPALKITQTGTGEVLRVQDSADPDTTPFIINSAGLVGLGTVSPTEALDIDNNGKIQFSSAGTSRTVIEADATNSTFDVKDNRNFVVRTNGSARFTVAGNGNVTFAGGITISSGGVAVTGNSTVTGTLGVSSTLTVSAGGLTVSAGGAAITGNSIVTGTFGTTGVLTAQSGVTVSSGGLTVSSGGAGITGNSTVTGTLGVSSALTVSSGGAAITGNSSVVGTLTATTFSGAWANIPAGTVMLFVQTAAPTGWTKSTAHDNKALRVVSGTASSGGSVAFTTAFASQAVTGTVASYTLTTADIPSHNHSATSTSTSTSSVTDPGHLHTFNGPVGTAFNYAVGGASASSVSGSTQNTSTATTGVTVATTTTTSTTIGNTGSGGGHAHGFSAPNINLAVQYVDVIIATKD